MRKHFKLLAFATALLTLAACADEDVMTPQQARDNSPESNAITFGAYSGKSATRADVGGYTGSMTNDLLKGQTPSTTTLTQELANKSGFGVFAFYTGTDT